MKLLLDTHAHGVITRPFRSSGILSTLVLARSAQGFQDRLQSKVRKLEETIKARRSVDYATEGIYEADLYVGELLEPGMTFEGPAITMLPGEPVRPLPGR